MKDPEGIIADTSVWMAFLKNNSQVSSMMSVLLEKNGILGVECVFGELLAGIKAPKEAEIILEYWDCLLKLDESNIWVEAGLYLNDKKLSLMGLGLIDSVLILLAIKNNVKVWSLDERLIKCLGADLSYHAFKILL